MKNKMFNYLLKPKTIDTIKFKEICKIIKNIKPQIKDWLSVAYEPTREDKISCIQTDRNKDDSYHLEIVMHLDNGNNFNIISYDTDDIEEIIAIFKFICVDYKCPIEIGWHQNNGIPNQLIIKKDIDLKNNFYDVTSSVIYYKRRKMSEKISKKIY